MAGSSVDDVGFAFHGEEEPLFADDLGDYDDDDLGRSTLPPPMPSLSELTEMQVGPRVSQLCTLPLVP